MDAMMIDGLTPVANSTKCANRKISAPCRPLNGTSTDDTEERGVLSWGTSFEKLLDDPAGMSTFAEFLKKEYSAENIYFWAACERYRQIDNDSDRQKQAVEIFSKHLSNGAMEPVNVDSHARNFAQQNLNGADRTLFHLAQKQIFHLMKFDSYQRFIRSDLFKKCLECFQKKLPLPYPGEQLDELLRTATEAPGPPKSEDCISESSSSLFDRIRRKDTTNIPVLRSNRQKKVVISNHKPILIKPSEEQNGNSNLTENCEPTTTSLSTSSSAAPLAAPASATPSTTTSTNLKPLIAKWKTGAKLQCTERTEKQGEEFIEGLKRAQRARLEDQRGVEINFELPDFLKNNENMSAANKLRKIRANLSPIHRQHSTESTKSNMSTVSNNNPIPAPRLSLTKASDVEVSSLTTPISIPTVPPPLPPKPKVLPAKPSNWGQNTSNISIMSSSSSSSVNLTGSVNSPGSVTSVNSPGSANSVNNSSTSSTTKIPNDIRRQPEQKPCSGSGSAGAYLDQPSSSFV